ncbi:hypothetical protein ERJ75_000030800 [Trypanosoma vivax]|nr:hypothetical protein ERJ75_000030800 [Trypanosoma vivax]
MTPRDRRTRQYQEGMYTRATIQAKLNEVSSKIRVTRATSSNLHHLIRDLENRVAREGLSDIKPAAYRNLQKKVNDNAKLIERLNDAILLSGGSVNATQDSGASECDEVLDKVRFPGKEKLEALSNKLSNQLSSLEERIAVIRSKLTVTPSTIELSHKPSASIRRTDEKLPTNDSECLDPASSHSITKFVLSTCPPHEHDANKAAAESKVTSECNESSATPGFSAPSILSAVKQPKQISANECHNASNLQVKYDTDHAPVKVAPLPPLVKSGRVLASKGNTVVSSMVSRTLNAKPFLCNNPTTLANAIAERTGAVLQSVLPPINGKPKGIRDIPTLDGRSGDVMQGLAELDRSVGAGEKEAVRAAGSSTVSDVTKSDESVGAGEKEAVRVAGSSTVSDVTKSGESVGAGEKEAVRAAGSSTVSDVTKSGESVGAGEKEAVRVAGSSTVSDVTKSGESVGAGEKEAVRAAGSSTVSDVTKSGESVGAGEKEAVRAAGSSTVSDVTKSGESVGAGEKEAVRVAGSSTVSDVTKSGESVGAGEKEAVRAAGSSTVSDVTKSDESVGAGEKEAVRVAGSSTVSDMAKAEQTGQSDSYKKHSSGPSTSPSYSNSFCSSQMHVDETVSDITSDSNTNGTSGRRLDGVLR